VARVIACDHCNDSIRQDDAEQGWYRLTNESLDMELWFCSPACIVSHVTAHQSNLGTEDSDGNDDI
jgi:hypothetical protein